jgi:methyl-accepting chemotaxis protein
MLRFRSLAARFLVTTLTLVVVVVGGLGGFLALRGAQSIRASLDSKASAVATLFENIASGYLLNFDYLALDALAADVLEDPDVAFVAVHDEKDKLLTKAAPPQNLKGLIVLERRIADGEGHALGTVRIGYRGDTISRVLRADATAATLSVVLAMLVFAAGMVVLIRGVTRPLERLNRFAQRVAEGDLTEAPEGSPGNDEVGRLQSALCTMIERLRTLLASLKNASEELSGAATILDHSTEDQTRLLQQQAAFLNEVSATTRQVEQASSAASHRAEKVLEIARDATEYSRSGEASAGESLAKVQEIRKYMQDIFARSSALGEQARQAGDIVESVQEIAVASQILSLNASIEAARAGEAGRGFTVVAQEVRALADQSGQSAMRIGKIVQDIASAVRATVEMTEKGNRGMETGIERIRASGESLKEIGSFMGTTSEAALQIAGAVKQQSAGVGQIATALADLDVRMKEAVRGIETVRQAAAKLTATSCSIRSVVNEFRA